VKNEARAPLYLQIQDYFKQLITTEKLKSNERIPTEKEVMEQFKVSRITVANALANLSKEEWIYRIPGRGSFVREDYPRANQQQADTICNEDSPAEPAGSTQPVKTNNKLIGLIMPTIDDFFAIRLLRGIGQVINNSPYSLILILSNNDLEQEKQAISKLIQIGAAGLLIFPVDQEVYNDEILALKINKFPFVLMDRYFLGVETNAVISDGSVGAQLAVSHLYDLGHRDIAICSDIAMPTITVEDRLSGYMKELKLREALINPSLILTDFTVDYQNLQEDHLLYRYIKNSRATAYITTNGKLGLWVYRIARRLGLRVPEDISIVTFDDPAAEFDVSVFTHISQSEDKMGNQAARILIETLEHDNGLQTSGYRKIIMIPELIINQTTGPIHSSANSGIRNR
jgi:GntR family transcriptional regulator of arabinose operon